MRIAVTGGMGFIGTEVVSRLIIKGHDVVIVDFWEQLIREYEDERYPVLETIYANLTTAEDVIDPFEFLRSDNLLDVEAVIHLGAVVDTTKMGSDLFDMNVSYTRDLAKKLKCPIVFASSAATYGMKGFPNNPYGLSKILAEKAIANEREDSLHAFDYSFLRFFNVFGKFEHHKKKMASMPFKLSQAYKEGRQLEMHSLDAARDFVPVSVVADCVIDKALTTRHSPSRTFDVGSGEATSFADLDNFVMQAARQTTSIVKSIAMPSSLIGRYQTWTKAGTWNPNIGSCSTREWLEKYYGKS